MEKGGVVRGFGLRIWREVSSLMLCTSVSGDCPDTGVAVVTPVGKTRTEDNVTWTAKCVRVVDVWAATSDKVKDLAKATQVFSSFDELWGMDCRYWPCRLFSALPCRVYGTGYPRCGGGPGFHDCGKTIIRALLNTGRFSHEFWFF